MYYCISIATKSDGEVCIYDARTQRTGCEVRRCESVKWVMVCVVSPLNSLSCLFWSVKMATCWDWKQTSEPSSSRLVCVTLSFSPIHQVWYCCSHTNTTTMVLCSFVLICLFEGCTFSVLVHTTESAAVSMEHLHSAQVCLCVNV